MRASRMNFGLQRTAAAALGMAFVLGLSAPPARAQFLGYWGGWRSDEVREVVPAPIIYRRLVARGYDVVSALQRNGGVYLADVIDRRGNRSRLVLDAYSGAVLQSFAFGPPRPAVGIPAEPPRYYPGPTYASRYPPDEAPLESEPRIVPEPMLRAPAHESRIKRPTHKVARREAAPSKGAVSKGGEPLASHATREPSPEPAKTQQNVGVAPAKNSTASNQKASASRDAETAAAPAPHPAPAGPKPASKPGYANGVPINPLD